jgi:hypothetical protein
MGTGLEQEYEKEQAQDVGNLMGHAVVRGWNRTVLAVA